MADEDFMNGPVELSPEKSRKRQRYRKFPRPECSPEERQALMNYQQGRCGICGEAFAAEELMTDHSYRTGKTRGLLCRAHNAALGHFKDSPKLLRQGLAYLRNPPAKALGFGESEKEKEKP